MSIEDMKRISEAEEEAVSIRRQAKEEARQIQVGGQLLPPGAASS